MMPVSATMKNSAFRSVRVVPPVRLVAALVAVAGAGVIRFDSISPESLFHLHNLVRYNAPDPDRIDEEILHRPGLR